MPRMNPSTIKGDTETSKQSSKKSSGRKSSSNESAKTEKKQRKKKQSSIKYYTHENHPLTVLEAKFIDLYMETGNGRQSVLEAGYTTKAPGQYAQSP